MVPFGGYERAALQAGYDDYQEQLAQPDPWTSLIDLGSAGEMGMHSLGSPTKETCDGLHPLSVRHGQLGAMLTAALFPYVPDPSYVDLYGPIQDKKSKFVSRGGLFFS